MSWAYGTYIKGIKDALVTTVKKADSFQTNTYSDYVKDVRWDQNPVAFVRLRSDTPTAIGTKETRHMITFTIDMRYQGGYEDDTLEKVIDYTGEIVDIIEANRDLGSNYASNTEVANIDYTYRAEEEAIVHHSYITLNITAYRNV